MSDKKYYIIETGHDHDDGITTIGHYFREPEPAIKFAKEYPLKKNCWICVSEWLDSAEFPTRLETAYYRKEM